MSDTPDTRWSQFQSGCTAVDIDGVRYLLTALYPDASTGAPLASATPLPEVLHELCVITSDNPGGFQRSGYLNKERRVEFRAQMVSLQLSSCLDRVYPAFGARDASLLGSVGGGIEEVDGVEYGLAVRLGGRFHLEDALAIGHEFGQLAIYHLVPAGRRLLACAMLQRNTDAAVQPMHCIKLALPR